MSVPGFLAPSMRCGRALACPAGFAADLKFSLVQEAHKMVREANTKQAASEKQLREARGKVRTALSATLSLC